MNEGYIDAASMFGIVAALSYKQPHECNRWSWQTAIEASCALIGMNHLKMSPHPSPTSPGSGPFVKLTRAISDIIAQIEPDQQVRQSAREKTKAWARRDYRKIRTAYDELWMNEDFLTWLDNYINYGWRQHSERLGGLFDHSFTPQIALVLDVQKHDLEDIWRLSLNQKVVETYAKRQPDEDGFRLMRDAFVASTLMRGRYHDYIAKASSWQILHHPIRTSMLPRLKEMPRAEVSLNTIQYLSNIILAVAFEEKQENRIASWVENFRKAREAALRGDIDIQPKESDDIALNVAIRDAKYLHIRTHSRLLDKALDVSVALGIGVLTSFVLLPWESFLAGMAAYAATYKKSPGELVGRALDRREGRLRTLAEAGPGRIERTWGIK
jgi:hypothetical protein